MKTNLPILLVHGFGDINFVAYRKIKAYFAERGNFEFHDFIYKEKFGQVPLEDVSKKLGEFIAETFNDREFNVVAYSQGGLIFRSYLNKYFNGRPRRCLTVCTPHYGSLIAYLWANPGVKDLRPRSEFIKTLDRANLRGVEFYATWNPFDLMVFPGFLAIFEKAKRVKMILASNHAKSLGAEKTNAYAFEVFTQKDIPIFEI